MNKQVHIQIASDLHEDVNKKGPLDTFGDHLVLAGDISDHIDHWEQYACIGRPVVAVLGNHEFMHKPGDVESRVSEFKDKYAFTNIHFLYNEILTLDGVNYIGSTLWSDISSVENTISANLDTVGASGLTYDEWHSEHVKAVEFLDGSLEALRGETNIVVTHFSPSYHSESPIYRNSPYGMFFHTNLEYLIREHRPLMWIHGHIHSPMDYYIGSTRVIANPRGHTLHNENPGFKKRFIVSLK